MIQFSINNQAVELEHCAPNLTILDYLRTKLGKTGTKEGCATGDCGACTILVGQYGAHASSPNQQTQQKSSWQYQAMNSCLLLVGNAHGKHIITVEALTTGLQPELVDLHPVQRALVECHGSQCGFCTPGIVMSLLALYLNHSTYPGQQAVIHALGGNLCRCTGYRPILAAAEQMYHYPRPASFIAEQAALTALSPNNNYSNSDGLNNSESNSKPEPFLQDGDKRFYLPQSLAALTALKAQYPQAQLVAGATDYAIELSQQLKQPQQLISVSQARELTELTITEQALEIGAALPYQQFVDSFCQQYPEAKELFERLGSEQVRSAGTLGGSLANASPIGDPAPLLIALNATIELASSQGNRTVAVADFFTGYRQTILAEDEVISRVIVPKRSANLKLACHKVSKRLEDDISTVCLVLAIEHSPTVGKVPGVITKARCALGGMAATPIRSHKIEQQLLGAHFTSASFAKAGQNLEQELAPMSDVRASADYRLTVTKNLLQRIGLVFCQAIEVVCEPSPKQESTSRLRIAHASL